jgi:uncharacterized protein YndB with AHSA1/START domain
MSRNYTIHTRIRKPIAEVFDAITTGNKLCRYFTSETSGDLVPGETIYWRWEDYHVELPVTVTRVDANECIELTLDSGAWEKTSTEAYPITVRFELEDLGDGSTMLAISESGWKTDADGLKGSHDNCSGWTHMAMCLKAWIEHDVDLR